MTMVKHNFRTGRTRGSMSARVAHPDFDEVMSEYRSLNTDEAKAAFADKMVRVCPEGYDNAWKCHSMAIASRRLLERFQE